MSGGAVAHAVEAGGQPRQGGWPRAVFGLAEFKDGCLRRAEQEAAS